MTFSKNVSRNDRKISRRGVKKRVARDVDFDVFS
jgi:hypothetical protein